MRAIAPSRHTSFRVSRFARRAFTLLEVCLVMAVLVAVAAMAWPMYASLMTTQQLKGAADQVRAAWMQARVEAMTSGQIQAFRYEPATGNYVIERYGGLDYDDPAAMMADPLAPVPLAASAVAGGVLNSKSLPEGVIFLIAAADLDLRGMWTLSQSGLPPDEQAPPILFYPDGTTTNATLYLGDEQQNAIRLDLRGLTGVVTVGDVEHLEVGL